MDKIADVFNTYGWPGIIALLLCFGIVIFWKFWKESKSSLNKNFDKFSQDISTTIQNSNTVLLSSITEQNQALMSSLATQNSNLIQSINNQNNELITYFITGRTKSHNEGLDTRLEISEQIDMEVSNLLRQSHATRVALLELHNGEVNLARLPFLKYTMHYEWPARGVESIGEKVTGLDASYLRVIINRVNARQDNVVILTSKDIDELHEVAPKLHEFLRVRLNLKNIVYVGLYCHTTNRLIGLLVCEYNQMLERDITDILEKYRATFSEVGNRISTHLHYMINSTHNSCNE